MASLTATEPCAIRTPGSPESSSPARRFSTFPAYPLVLPPGQSFTALGNSLCATVYPQDYYKSPHQVKSVDPVLNPFLNLQSIAMPSSNASATTSANVFSFSPNSTSEPLFFNQSPIPSHAQAPTTSHSAFHNTGLSSFPMNSNSPQFTIDPAQLSQSRRAPSTSASDISQSPNAGFQHLHQSSHTSQDVYLTANQTLQLLEHSDVRRPSSGGSIHSDFSHFSGQANGSPRFDNVGLDYGLHHTSDAASIASIGSSSGLSYQYDQPDQPAHSSPASFSVHSRNSSISSIPPDSIQPAYPLSSVYASRRVLEPFSAPDQNFDQIRAQGGHQRAFRFPMTGSQFKLDAQAEEDGRVKRDSTHPALSDFPSCIPELQYTNPAGAQNAYSSKPPTLNIATDLSANPPTYLHPNDALQRPGQARRSPARQRSRSEGDLLTRLLAEAQAGTNADRQMLKDDAGVQRMAAIALSPKTPVQFHAENHFQFPPTHRAISPPSSLEPIASNLFLTPSIAFAQESLDSSSQSRRRRAVSVGLGLTPIQNTFNDMLPFEHPLLTDHRTQLPSSSALPPQIVLSSEFASQGSPGRMPDLTPEFVLPPGGGKMDLDEPSGSEYNSKFIPFQSGLTGFETSSATSSPNPSQASYVSSTTPSSENISFGQMDTYQVSSGAGRVSGSSENQMFRANAFESRPLFTLPFGSPDCTSAQHPIADMYAAPLQTYSSYNDPASQQQQHARPHQPPQTGWSDGSGPMTGIFGFGLEPEPSGSEASGSNVKQAALPDSKERNVGGRIRRIAPATKNCLDCGASFTRKDRLKYHIESKHLKLEPHFLCEVPGCVKAFRQRSDLVRHTKHVHRDLQAQNNGTGSDHEPHNRRKSK